MRFVSLGLFYCIKFLSHLFFHIQATWVNNGQSDPWSEDIRIIALLNHTSLFEPLFITAFPWRVLKRLAWNIVMPGADKTLSRPIVGRFWRLLSPGLISITRKRDDTWAQFLDEIGPRSVVAIAAEGRMKRRDGLDSNKKPMTVRGGIVDCLEKIGKGKMLLLYSGGLHHVQAPGEFFVRLFKSLSLRLELVDIESYLDLFPPDPTQRKRGIIKDLERRRDQHCRSD